MKHLFLRKKTKLANSELGIEKKKFNFLLYYHIIKMTSYYGNSKQQLVQNEVFTGRLTTIEATASADKVFLEGKVADEASARVSADGVLNARISTEKAFLEGKVADEATARVSADGVLNAKIDAREASLLNYINTKHDEEKNARISADNLIKADLTALTTSTDTRFLSATGRLTTLESGLASQVNAMIANNALDAVQSALITQHATELGTSNSVIYERIAEKASLLVNNEFKAKFNSYLTDFFANYTIMAGPSGARVEKTASDYSVSPEVPVNNDPTL